VTPAVRLFCALHAASLYVNSHSLLIVCWLLMYNLTLMAKIIGLYSEVETKIEINKRLLGNSKIECSIWT